MAWTDALSVPRMSSPLHLALPLLAAMLAGVMGLELMTDPGAPAPLLERATIPPPPAAPGPQASAAAGDWTRITLARPLFQRDRRPVVAASTTVATTLPRLTGLLSGPFGRRAVLIDAEGRSVTVQEGSPFGSWRVLAIGSASVSVTGSTGEYALSLARKPDAPAVTPPIATAELDDHATGEPQRRPKSRPMMRFPGDPPAGWR